jgi:hypothetical protein
VKGFQRGFIARKLLKVWRREWDSNRAISSKYSDYYHLRILARVYAGCKHILIFGCSAKLSPQSPQFSCFR